MDEVRPIIVLEAERLLLRQQRKIIISGDIDAGSAHEFISDMEILVSNGTDQITVIISSSGGSAEYGNGYISAIRKAQKQGVKIIGSVYGQATSMAFFILQACDERVMGELDTIMAHGLTATSVGDMRNREAEDKLLKFFQGEYAKLVSSRCSRYNILWWKKLLADNTPKFFNSKESLEIGLVDRIE